MTDRAQTTSTDETRRSRQRRPSGESRSGDRDLATWDRAASVALGGILLVRGLVRGSRPGAARVLASGWLLYRGLTGRDPLYRAIGASTSGRSGAGTPEGPLSVERTVVVGRPAEELSDVWSDPEQVSRILGGFAEVTPAGDGRWRWTATDPLGRSLSWKSEIAEDRPGEVLRWRSLDGAPVPNEGTVRFRPAPTDRGTEVTLTLEFDPPGGALGSAAMTRLDVIPGTLAAGVLDRFKSLAETGEIPTLEGNPSGRGSGDIA